MITECEHSRISLLVLEGNTRFYRVFAVQGVSNSNAMQYPRKGQSIHTVSVILLHIDKVDGG